MEEKTDKNADECDFRKLDKVQTPYYKMESDAISKGRKNMYSLLQKANLGEIDTPTLYERGTKLSNRLKGGNGTYLPEDLQSACDFIGDLKESPEKDRREETGHYLEMLKTGGEIRKAYPEKNPEGDVFSNLRKVYHQFKNGELSPIDALSKAKNLEQKFSEVSDLFYDTFRDLENEIGEELEFGTPVHALEKKE